MSTITIITGTTRTLELSVVDGDGVAVDITASDLYFTVKLDVESDTAQIEKSTAVVTEIDIVDGPAGRADIYLQPGDTASMDKGTFVFDVFIVLASGDRHSLIQDGFTVRPSVTVLP